MKYIFSFFFFNLSFFAIVFDSKAVLDIYEDSSKGSTHDTSHVITKRALSQLNQEVPSPVSPSKKSRITQDQRPINPESSDLIKSNDEFLAAFAMCLAPCTEVLDDSDDEVPSLSSSPPQNIRIARLNAIARRKLQENYFSDEGTIRLKWHRNIYNSTLMLSESNG